MFGPRLFRSRWVALIWAAGVVWTAYDVVGAAPTKHDKAGAATVEDATGEAVDPAALAALANAAVN